jgi:mannose-1-phosphate guanylyltransferase/phosphomannomutase
MRQAGESGEALRQVSEIVKALGADIGFCLSPSGESLHLVDDLGRVRAHHETLLVALKLLVDANRTESIRAFLPVSAPRSLDELVSGSLRIERGKTVSLKTSRMHDYAFIAEREGCYAFPQFLHAPDAMFAVAKFLELLGKVGRRVSQVIEDLPSFSYWREEIACPVDKEGLAMRRMSEDSVDKEASFVDGVQVLLDSTSVLLLPDPYKPTLHLVVEGADPATVRELASAYQTKVRGWVGE